MNQELAGTGRVEAAAVAAVEDGFMTISTGTASPDLLVADCLSR